MTTRTTFSLQFYCRESKTDKQGLAPVELSININGTRLFLNLPTKLSPKDFNKKKQPPHIIQLIEEYRIKANEVIIDLMRYGLPITASLVREYMRTGGMKSRTIEYLWQEYFKILKRRNIELTKYRLCEKICYEVFGKDRELATIQNKDIIELYDKLKLKYKSSTSAGYMTKIKSAFLFGKDNDFIKINPFVSIKIEKERTEIIYLTEEEIKQIENTEFDGYLDRAKDLLLFQMYAGGMAYCDMIKFNPNNIILENDIYTYSNRRQKTNVPFNTIILPQAIKILNKYNNMLPIISNQKLNSYAKLIAQGAGINKNITSHIMRKTFAHLMLNNGISIESIAKMLGHTTTNITQRIYCTKSTESITNEVKLKLNL